MNECSIRVYAIKTIFMDVSQSGLGALLLQDGKPVVYATHKVSGVEKRYAQIEKNC